MWFGSVDCSISGGVANAAKWQPDCEKLTWRVSSGNHPFIGWQARIENNLFIYLFIGYYLGLMYKGACNNILDLFNTSFISAALRILPLRWARNQKSCPDGVIVNYFCAKCSDIWSACWLGIEHLVRPVGVNSGNPNMIELTEVERNPTVVRAAKQLCDQWYRLVKWMTWARLMLEAGI